MRKRLKGKENGYLLILSLEFSFEIDGFHQYGVHASKLEGTNRYLELSISIPKVNLWNELFSTHLPMVQYFGWTRTKFCQFQDSVLYAFALPWNRDLESASMAETVFAPPVAAVIKMVVFCDRNAKDPSMLILLKLSLTLNIP